MQRVFWAILIGLSFFFVGCSSPPELPILENSRTQSFPEIALRDLLTPDDFRKIFEALNSKGQLNGFKPWLNSTSNHDLKILGAAANEYLYQDAFNPEGLPALIQNQVDLKSFSDLSKDLENLNKKYPSLPLNQVLSSTLSHSSLPKLLKRNSYLFNPEWHRAFKPFKVSTLSYSEFLADNSQLLKDLSQLFENPSFEKNLIILSKHLRVSELGKNVFLTFQSLGQERGASIFRELSQSVIKSLKATQESPSQVTRFLKLAELLNRPTSGLFLKAQQTLKTDEGQALVRLLSERFEPMILKGTSGFIRETLKEPFDDLELNAKFWLELPRKNISDPPTKNLIHLLQRIQFALDKTSNSSRIIKDTSVTLNSFLLAEWFEHYARANHDLINALPVENFDKFFWQQPIKSFSFALNLLELDEEKKPIKDNNGKFILASKIDLELKALGLKEFSNDLEWSVKQKSFGPTITKIASGGNTSTLKESLEKTLVALHRAHPLADPVPFLTSMAFLFSRPEEGSPLILADLESPNMLNSIQNFLKGLSFSHIRKLITFLFEDLQIGNISIEDRERLKSLYPNNPETAELLDSILQNLQVLYELDAHLPNQISLLEFYHSFLVHCRDNDIKGLTALFSFLQSTTLLEVSPSGAKYPGLIQALTHEIALSRFIQSLGEATQEQQESLLKISRSVIGTKDSDISELSSFFKDILIKNIKTLQILINLSQEGSLNLSLTESEQKWIYRFISSGSFSDLYRILVELNTSQNLSQFVSELEALQGRGEFENTIKILGNLKSDRMQRLASILWRWEKSRELRSLFSLIKSLTKS